MAPEHKNVIATQATSFRCMINKVVWSPKSSRYGIKRPFQRYRSNTSNSSNIEITFYRMKKKVNGSEENYRI